MYAGGRRVADVPLDAISDWVAKDGHVVWVGLHEPSGATLRALQAELGLHELAVEDAHRAHQRPKLEEYGHNLFVVLRTAAWNPDEHTVSVGETHVFVGARYVLTVRHDPASVTRTCARAEASAHLLAHGPGFVLNFEHMPELQARWGSPLALGSMAGVAGVLYRRLRRADWL